MLNKVKEGVYFDKEIDLLKSSKNPDIVSCEMFCEMNYTIRSGELYKIAMKDMIRKISTKNQTN